MDVDEDLLNGDDDTDADYNLDNDAENALLEEGSEASYGSTSKNNKNENEQDPEDVLDLLANEVELNEEDEYDDNATSVFNSSQSSSQGDAPKHERNKFSSERNTEPSATTEGVKYSANKKVNNFNNNRQFQRNRGRGRGGRNFYMRKEGRKVLINPHFKGNVQVPNGTRLLWDSNKSQNNSSYTEQTTFKSPIGNIHSWTPPIPPNNQHNFMPSVSNYSPPVNLPMMPQEPIIPLQPLPWNQCNVPNNFPQPINRNIPVHQRLGYGNNFNPPPQPLLQQPAQFMQPNVYHQPVNNAFNHPPPATPQFIPSFNTPPPPTFHPAPINQPEAFFNPYEPPPRSAPHYDHFQPQNPVEQQTFGNIQRNFITPSFKPVQNNYQPVQNISPQNKFNQFTLPKRNYESKNFDHRKKKRVLNQNLQEVPTVGDVREIKENNSTELNNEEQEDEETKEYRKMIEKQKEARQKILQAKEARRLLNLKTGTSPPGVLAPAELVKKLTVPADSAKKVIIENHNTIQVQIKNKQCKSTALQKRERTVQLDEQADDNADDTASFASSFLTNRKVLCKDQFLPETPLVVIKDLASGTTEVKLYKLCSGIGDVQKLQLSKQERQATIQFKSVASAHAFYKKYQRFMLDLSMIQVTLQPMN